MNVNKRIEVNNDSIYQKRRDDAKKVAKIAALLGALTGFTLNTVDKYNNEHDGGIDTKVELFSSPTVWDSYNPDDSTVILKTDDGEIVIPVGVVSIGQDGNTIFDAAGSAVAYGAIEDQETLRNEFTSQNGENGSLVHVGDNFIYETHPQELPAGN